MSLVQQCYSAALTTLEVANMTKDAPVSGLPHYHSSFGMEGRKEQTITAGNKKSFHQQPYAATTSKGVVNSPVFSTTRGLVTPGMRALCLRSFLPSRNVILSAGCVSSHQMADP